MKQKFTLASVCLTVASLSATVNAETFVNESFAYPTGNLYGKGDWVKYGQKSSYPIPVEEGSLTYEDYQTAAKGNSANLSNEAGESLQIIFKDKESAPVEGAVYYSALINIKDLAAKSKTTAFISLTGSDSADPTKFGDSVTGSEGGGLFARTTDDGGFNLGVNRCVRNAGLSKADVSWSADTYQFGTTYLIVVKYEQKEGTDNDIVTLWVNPQNGSDIPTASAVSDASSSTETLSDIRGIQLRQGSFAMAKTPTVKIDEVRVASTWEEIFTPASTEQPDSPEITLSTMSVDYGKVYQGLTYKTKINIKATNLTEDITISGLASGEISTGEIRAIPKEQAQSETGYDLEITLLAGNIAKNSDNITLTSGAAARNVNLSWRPIETVTVNSLKELYDEENISMTTVYLYKGEATVTCIDKAFFTFYAQDATAGAEFRSAAGCGYDEVDLSKVNEGDNITNIVGSVVFSDDGGVDLVPAETDSWEVVSSGNTITPQELTFEQIRNSDAWEVMFRLVTVKEVVFDEKYRNYPDQDFYGKFNVPYHVTSDGTKTGWLWYFHDTDISGSSTAGYFDNTWKVTGICYYMAPTPAIAPRTLSDFEMQREGAVEGIETDVATVVAVYDLYGRQVKNPEDGIYIEKLSDGSSRKAVYRNGRK